MTTLEFDACDGCVEKFEAYVSLADVLDEDVPVDVLRDLCDPCQSSLRWAIQDGPWN